MATIKLDDVLGRLRRLDRLVTAYGHILIASELDRPLPAVIPLLVSDSLSASEAGDLVKEILRRGGAALVADLEEVERLIRQAKKDPQISDALRGVRLTFRHTARLHAGALARKMQRAVQAGVVAGPEAPALQKELEAFISGVAQAVREDDVEFEEVFASEDLATDGEAPVSIEDGRGALEEEQATEEPPRRSPREEPPVPPLFKEGPETPLGGQWDASDQEAADQEGEAGAKERPLDWLRDRVDVYNEMLARWGGRVAFVPESSSLVRRGMLTPERCAELYHDLLAEGASRLVDRIEEFGAASDRDDRLRFLRTRIADGLAAGVPRILALLVSGETLPADLDGVPRGSRGALADLTVYLTRAVDLFDEASPQHSRLGYLASELRSALRPTSA